MPADSPASGPSVAGPPKSSDAGLSWDVWGNMFHSREYAALENAVNKDSISIKVFGNGGVGSAPMGLGKGKRGGAPPLSSEKFPLPPVFLQRLFFQTVLAHLPV